MTRTRLGNWEQALHQVLDRIDDHLEKKYGHMYPLRANRPSRGVTANSKYDGLFSVEAKFSLGLVSRQGPGYLVDVRMSTFSQVPEDVRQNIQDDAEDILLEELPRAFPDRKLTITRQGDNYHIQGDLGLD